MEAGKAKLDSLVSDVIMKSKEAALSGRCSFLLFDIDDDDYYYYHVDDDDNYDDGDDDDDD
eukprot:1400684-Karenia_brevis.AAC.1